MMDETTGELLSRHLDGDLSPDEERELKRRLEDDASLAAQLEAMRQIRSSIASLAASEHAPGELDRVLEPLLASRPERVVVRPWARWLAAAAVAVLGFTVVIEVNRRNPGPDIGAIARHADKGPSHFEEPFALAPLPTSSVPADEQPLGASDRLLASPVPDIELEEPLPLEVLGPLEGEIGSDGLSGMITDETAAAPLDGKAETEKKASTDRPKSAATLGTQREGAQTTEESARGRAQEMDRNAAPQPWDVSVPKGRAQLFVFINGTSAWSEFTPPRSCTPGRYTVRVTVRDGTVREAKPVGGPTSPLPSQRLCAAGLIIGLEIRDVADGEYQAEVVVERR
jgi:hypothetical protein